MSRLENWYEIYKRGGSINRGDGKYLIERIVGEALIKASRVETWY